MKKDLQFEYPVSHSLHSRYRADQRGISVEHIQEALNYSISYFKQGLIFHIVKNKLLPDKLNKEIRRKIKNLVIIIAGDSGTIITCYRSKNAMHDIKKKSKVLKNYGNVA
jgi:hypothetical protein